MSRITAIKVAVVFLILVSAASVSLLALTLETAPETALGRDSNPSFPGITLGLTAEARESLQQSGGAFPSAEAGFSAYHRVPDGADGFGLDKAVIDQKLLGNDAPTLRRAGIGQAVRMGDNYSVVKVPILNIGQLTSEVHVYYDSEGWIVAYVAAEDQGAARPSSQAWQARWNLDQPVNAENPTLTDVSSTTLLDAINDILVEALGAAPLGPAEAGYYHWAFPGATSFLMIATARGAVGADFVAFSVPDSFTVLEVSVSMWVSSSGNACARTTLDGVNLTGDQCDTGFYHAFANLGEFNSRSTDTMRLEKLNADSGGAGTLLMLVYSAPGQ